MTVQADNVRVLDAHLQQDEVSFDRQLRPVTLDEFVGQTSLKERLKIFIEAARLRTENLSHVLFHGPPGLGKTTLAHIIANEMQSPLRVTSGPVLDKPGDMAGILTNLERKGTLFIDECHRMPVAIEEILYPAMEEYKFDILVGDGPLAKSIRMELPPFTVVGATTRVGLLTNPLLDRFDIVLHLEYYDSDDLAQIVLRSARKLSISIHDDGAEEIARRSRATPRVANRLLRLVRDFAQVRADGVITKDIADQALSLFEVDQAGLDSLDLKYLNSVVQKYQGGPVGIETLSASLGEERDTLEEVVEPFLIQQGFLMRTRQGRVATRLAWDHLGINNLGLDFVDNQTNSDR
ncbi:MAG: Holliday junction branch migration DNA helicase RuvB [Gammaproteobacteria bacterium]|nr:Holliday junction branch migration DNA helicase RuvB [Gammaproteobacteria bacterium]MYF01794.1 Holliday junction branch migration DNA helicase RuvB [Gammaproteobacteria bacterium]MYI78089.1 Holliday junction branch migration DNA helicase RuvB [Gammaproteobacteria bacterium]